MNILMSMLKLKGGIYLITKETYLNIWIFIHFIQNIHLNDWTLKYWLNFKCIL